MLLNLTLTFFLLSVTHQQTCIVQILDIEQEKTGAKLGILLSLKCDAIGMTLYDIVSMCRDLFVSLYLVHHRHVTGRASRGDKVTPTTLTATLKNTRDKYGFKWQKGTAPSFNEQRKTVLRAKYRHAKITKT